MSSTDLDIDAGRLLFGLSRIGYTTTSALCDIVDNSVRAKASVINIIIKKERDELSDIRKNNVSQYVVIDNGEGMDRNGLIEALKLGSSESDYESHTLSKFGLGMKSATFSQGETLELISSAGQDFIKYRVSLPEVMQQKKYFANNPDLSAEDQTLIKQYLPNGRGTIVRLADIRKNNHPSVKNTLKELRSKLGVIYYYFIQEQGLDIYLEGERIKPFDPLFTEEADANGNLNENEWEGLDVRWIEKPKTLTLDDEAGVSATIEVTQMPYPPIFKLKPIGDYQDHSIRDKYRIDASNYGFYVYRNKRLISWATHLDGIIPYDQDFYAFRGRVIIDDTADDFFNIDVKKSVLTLSEEAWNSISDFTKDAKSKSKAAWLNAGRVRKEIMNQDPNDIANRLLEQFDQIELLPGDEELDEDDAARRIESILADMAKKIKVIVRMMRQDKGEPASDDSDPTPAEKEAAVKGQSNLELSKIFRVSSVMDNLLWEYYYDTDLGKCVRINKMHRFAKYIYEDNSENRDLQIIFDLFMLQVAEAEHYVYTVIPDYSYEQLNPILYEFRRVISEFLANMCRRLEDSLPPNDKLLDT